MDEFLGLPPDEQRVYFDEAQSKINLPAATIEKDFWVTWTLQELFGRGIARAYRLSSRARTMTEEPRRKNAAVVHHQQIVRAQQAGEIEEFPVFEFTGSTAQMQHARVAARRQRLLRDQFVW